MKRTVVAALAALTLMSGTALAQGLQASGTRAGGPGQFGAPGELMPEQRTWVRGYVMARPAPVVAVEEDIAPGWVVPPTVVLTPFARDSYRAFPDARRYSYFRTDDDEVVLVDPRSRRVVTVLED
jgi:hypothetical protein